MGKGAPLSHASLAGAVGGTEDPSLHQDSLSSLRENRCMYEDSAGSFVDFAWCCKVACQVAVPLPGLAAPS